ncbi:MAG TPA: chemotaxis response regulator protein-glutamate methylesterase [Terriglobales bacterium]|nr:chemotaxis response regulator protein-glutamate methylesterase [Terriglobales bacterium]
MNLPGINRPIRVLVVDDSSFMRIALTRIIQSDPELEVVGCAQDGREALEMTEELHPDVITMDVEMPRMNGLEALRRLMASAPRPVIMVSSATQEGVQTTFDALDCGAFDYIPKNVGSRAMDVTHIRRDLVGKLKSAAENRGRIRCVRPPDEIVVRREIGNRREPSAPPAAICIGCSTGGPRALQHILPALPAHLPVGIVVVQHMPMGFTGPFASRLDSISKVHVKEAEADDWVDAGSVLIAPAGWHVTLYQRTHSRYAVRLSRTPGDTLHTPSVDVLMLSAAEVLRSRSMGIVLTGMGSDGSAGMKAIHEAGGYTVAQDEQTSAVYGMPRACVAAGAVKKLVPLADISDEIVAAATWKPLWMVFEGAGQVTECRLRVRFSEYLLDLLGKGIERKGFLKIVEVGVGKTLTDN